MYGLSAEDLDIQARARAFADELIPLEVTAELHGLPEGVVAAHEKRARELGLFATNMPAELGGGCTALQQVLVQEQAGRVTNALGWVAATPPFLVRARRHPRPAGALRQADHPRRAHRVLRDHRGGRGLRRGRHRGHRLPGRG
jgi:alkylation response protein AidB-like acyl-CoA dehydrogenase